MKKLLKLLGLSLVVLFGAQSSVNAVCRRCMVNRQATAAQYIDFEQDGEVAPACPRQVSDKTVAARQASKQASKQISKLQDTKSRVAAQVAVWAQAAKARMVETRVRLAAWTQAKTAWMRTKKQAIAAYIKARRKA